MFLPRITATANSYFLWVGLHKSTTRPRTPSRRVGRRLGEGKGSSYQGRFLTDWLTFLSIWPLFRILADRHWLARAAGRSRVISRLSPSQVVCQENEISGWSGMRGVLDPRTLGVLLVQFLSRVLEVPIEAADFLFELQETVSWAGVFQAM
jgi:hypothetical protein